jgi:hypothetical protein
MKGPRFNGVDQILEIDSGKRCYWKSYVSFGVVDWFNHVYYISN